VGGVKTVGPSKEENVPGAKISQNVWRSSEVNSHAKKINK